MKLTNASLSLVFAVCLVQLTAARALPAGVNVYSGKSYGRDLKRMDNDYSQRGVFRRDFPNHAGAAIEALAELTKPAPDTSTDHSEDVNQEDDDTSRAHEQGKDHFNDEDVDDENLNDEDVDDGDY